jgi:hypothetical protein
VVLAGFSQGAGVAIDTAVEESRSLARVLDEAHRPAQYVEFDGPHTIPMVVVRGRLMIGFSSRGPRPVRRPAPTRESGSC